MQGQNDGSQDSTTGSDKVYRLCSNEMSKCARAPWHLIPSLIV
ncbi:predicted protein [Botrytis cinerea T4]|uniref:Uncharacterized protein n=1 Tax=Botryotinia fuckeliana (strain T4) TaxID=999810 RepID=G2YIK2_BOTF4|nr:predicted protein [Botrytis cinerea T4]